MAGFDDILSESYGAPEGSPSPSKPATTSPFDAILDDVASTSSLHVSLDEAMTRNPVDETKRQRIARKLGVSSDLLPPTSAAQAEADRADMDPAVLKAKAPSTAKWLEVQNNANVAAMEHKSLSKLEESSRAMANDIVAEAKRIAGSVVASIPATKAATWGWAQAASDVLLPFENPVSDYFTRKRKQQEVFAKILRPDTEGMGPIRRGVYGGVESAATTALLLPLAGLRAAAGGAEAALAATRLLAGSGAAVTAGKSYGEAKDAKVGTGQSLVYAASQGAVEYWTEFGASGALIGALTAKTGLMKHAVSFLKKEVWGELKANAIQDLNTWATINPDRPFSEYLAARPAAAIETVSATIVGGGAQLGAARGVGAVLREHARPEDVASIGSLRQSDLSTAQKGKAIADYGSLKAFVAQAAESPLRGYNQEAFHDFTTNMSEDGSAPEHVFIDAQVLTRALEDAKIDVSTMPTVAAQLQDASALSGDVKVPFADLATHLSAAPNIDTILQHTKLDPDGPSYGQAIASTEELQASLTEEAKGIAGPDTPAGKKLKKTPEPVLSREDFEAKRLREDIAQEATAAPVQGPVVTAELPGGGTLGRRSESGTSLRDAIEQLPPAEKEAKLRALRTDIKDLAPSEKDAAIHELRLEVMVDKMTGIGSLLAYNDAVASIVAEGGIPWHASFDAAGLKWQNDTMGPEAGDAMLIAIGRAAVKVAPTRSFRTGGDEYMILGKTEAEVEAKSAEMHALLKTASITSTRPDGTVITKKGVEIAHGIGSDKASADAKLKRDKEQRIASGAETARGTKPPGVVAVTSTGESYNFSPAPGRTYESYLAAHSNKRAAFAAGTEEVRKKLLAQMGVGKKKKVLTRAEFEAQKSKPKIRRTDADLRKAVDAIPDEKDRAATIRMLHATPEGLTELEKDEVILELRRTLLVDPLTKIGSRAAYEAMLASGKRKFHASFDGNGIKWFNDYMSMKSGDHVLVAVGQAIKELTDYGYRVGGDEYIILGENAEELLAIVPKVNALLALARIIAQKPDGTLVEKTGVEVSIGIGANKADADAQMKADKSARILAGKETPRGDEPPGVIKQYNQATYEAYLESEGVARGSRFSDAVNKTNITPIMAFYEVHAKLLNTTVPELYEKYPLKIGVAPPALGQKVLMQDRQGSFFPERLTISLLKDADLSTFIHESGHFYLEVMSAIAGRQDAPPRVVADFDKVLTWFGVKDRATWAAMTLEEKTPFHEQWAESYERWTIEGKSPTVDLQPTFSRFRAWMNSVYKSVEELIRQRPLAGKLNDEIRFVFGRLLASENEILIAEQARGYVAIKKPDGVTDAEYKKYQDLNDAATAQATEDLQARSIRAAKWMSGAQSRVLKELQGQAKEERQKVKAEVTKEVMAEPINLARKWLTTGETVDQEGAEVKASAGYKLDKEALAQMYPESGLINPDLTKLRKMVGTKGLHPDQVAQMFGFSSGDALVLELISGEDAKAKIEGITDQRMLEQHGELIDARAIADAVRAATHNEGRIRFMAAGLKMLTKSSVPIGQIVKAATQAAQAAISGKLVRDIHPAQFESAEKRANKAMLAELVNAPAKADSARRDALDAGAAKDVASEKRASNLAEAPVRAVNAQRTAILNGALTKEAVSALAEVEDAVKYLAKFDADGTRKALSSDYLDQIDDLRQGFDLRKSESLKAIDKKKDLLKFIAQQEALGFEPVIDPVQVEAAKKKHYKDMTMDELRGLVDTIKHIEHLGRLEKRLLTARDKREFAERMAEADASIRANANRTVPERASPTDVAGRTAQWARQMSAMHRKASSLIREMDGVKDDGVMYNLFLAPMNDAGDLKTQMQVDISKKLAELFSPIMKTLDAGLFYTRKRVVPGTNLSMTHEQRIMFVMNMGTASSRQRILDNGISGNRSITPQTAQRVVDSLTKAEMDFVQKMWDYNSTFRPAIAALEKQLTGREPEWLEPEAINTPHGEYPGGYHPAKYDAELSARAEALEAFADIRQAMKGVFGSSATRHSFTKKRAEEVKGRPLLLSFSVIAQHLNEVSHRLAYQPWLTDAKRTLQALDAPIREHYGVEHLRELKLLVDDITTGGAPASGPTEVFLNRLRTGSTIVGMGWRISTALVQLSGLTQSWARVGGVWVAKGLAEYAADPEGVTQRVLEESSAMKNRGLTMEQGINDILNTVRAGEGITAVTGSYFYLIHRMQQLVDIPTYLGAYQKAAAELQLERAGSAEQRDEIKRKVIGLAAQAVLDSQGGGQLKDLSRVQRGSPVWKLFTNFYSYFNTTLQLNVEAYRKTKFKDPTSVGLFAADMVIINTVPVLFSVALKEVMKGSCEDWECVLKKLPAEQLGYLMGQIVLLRDAAPAVVAGLGGDSYDYAGPPSLRLYRDAAKLGKEVGQVWSDGTDAADMKLLTSAINVGGVLGHYPAGQINATLLGIMAIENGDVEGTGILPALLVGPPKKE